MELYEGGNFKDLEDVKDYDFKEDGFCTYRGRYYIISIDHFNLYGVMKKLSDRAAEEGLEFPQSFNSNAKFFLCTSKGTPYNGGKNYNKCYFNTIEEVVEAMSTKLDESLKGKIRLALKEDSLAKKMTRWNPDTQPNIYQLDVFLRKSGYRLVDVLDNGGYPEVIIESMKEGHLHPDITYSVEEKVFFIEVKKYGQLPASDVEEIIKGYQTAVSVVNHLDKLDLNKLEFRREGDKNDAETN